MRLGASKIKSLLRRLVERQGYYVFSKRLFGYALEDDLQRLIGPARSPVVVDAGANCGQTLTRIKRMYPRARVWCYEPDPRAFAELRTTASRWPDVTCRPVALGSVHASSSFFRNQDSATNSLLPTNLEASGDLGAFPKQMLQPLDTITVEVRTLVEEWDSFGSATLDLLKTDCQGSDLSVLQGAEGLLLAGRVRHILCEVLLHKMYDGQAYLEEVLSWLRARRFALFGLYGFGRARSGRLLYANALFRGLDLEQGGKTLPTGQDFSSLA